VEENKTVKNLEAPKGLTKTFNIGSVESPKKFFAEKTIRKTVCVPRTILTTNKTNYTVTNYLPNKNSLTNSNNKQPTRKLPYNLLDCLIRRVLEHLSEKKLLKLTKTILNKLKKEYEIRKIILYIAIYLSLKNTFEQKLLGGVFFG